MRPAILIIGSLLIFASPSVDARPARPAQSGAAAAANPSDEATEQRAQQTLAAGQAAFAQGALKVAADKASESLRISPSPEALLLLGRIALADGRTLQAQDFLRRYLADPDLETDDQSPAQIEARRVSEKLPIESGQLKILGNAGTQVILDGRLVGLLPLSLPLLVAVGSHKVELLRGRVRLEDEVRIPVGRLAELRSDTGRNALISSILPGVVLFDEYRGVDATMERRLGRALETAVDTEHLSLLLREFVLETAGEPPPGPCLDEARCLMTLTERSQADYLLRLHVSRSGSPAVWQLDLQLFDAEIGAIAASDSQSCSNCDLEQAARTLGGMFAPLYKSAIARPRGRLALLSEPSGAAVMLDGKKVGTTPFERPLFAGNRALTLKLEGYLDATQEVAIADGETAHLTVRLLSVPEPPPPSIVPPPPPPIQKKERARPLWRIVTGSILIAGGLFSVGVGAGAVVVDGHCAEPLNLSSTSTTICSQRYVGTTQLGEVLLPLGGALVLGGTLLLALPKKTTAPPRDSANQGVVK